VRADRLLGLLLVLQVKGKTTARALAGELGVSVRTIYRDLEALGAAGVPVWAEGGPGGGCQLIEGYRSPLVGITADDAIALLATSSPAAVAGSSLSGEVTTAHLTLLAALPAGTRRHVVAQTAKFHVDAPAWFSPAPPVPHLGALLHAVRTDRRVRLSFSGRRDVSRAKTVEPWGLVAKAGRWYLVGVMNARQAVYRVDRLAGAEVLAEMFVRPEDFDLAHFWRAWLENFESGLGRVTARVRIRPDLWDALPEIFGEAVMQKMQAADGPDPAGWWVIELSFETIEAATTRLLGLGARAEVIAPLEVREMVEGAAKELADLYSKAQT
jgi:predicted DNA-binding transcriptional regulator YafY